VQKFIIREIYDNLTARNRPNGDIYYIFRDTAPKEMQQTFSDLMAIYIDKNIAKPDEIYKVLNELVIQLMNTNITDTNELKKYILAIKWADPYRYDRLMWLEDDPILAHYYDEISGNKAGGLSEIIGAMQQRSRSNMAMHIFRGFIKV
jgi:hypothetical protein